VAWVATAWLVVVAGTTGAADLRDPTRPPQGGVQHSAPAAPAAPLRLDFVVSSTDRRMARINGQWVAQGDTVAGATVQRIESDRVIVRRDDRTSVLRLGGEGIRKSTTEQ
jgi:hypothetical protein